MDTSIPAGARLTLGENPLPSAAGQYQEAIRILEMLGSFEPPTDLRCCRKGRIYTKASSRVLPVESRRYRIGRLSSQRIARKRSSASSPTYRLGFEPLATGAA